MENTLTPTVEKTGKHEPVRCAYCGRLVRSKDQLQYPEDALCWKCLKDPGVGGPAND